MASTETPSPSARFVRDVVVLVLSALVATVFLIALAYLAGLVAHFVYDAALAGWNER